MLVTIGFLSIIGLAFGFGTIVDGAMSYKPAKMAVGVVLFTVASAIMILH